jgi:hypothetical protein
MAWKNINRLTEVGPVLEEEGALDTGKGSRWEADGKRLRKGFSGASASLASGAERKLSTDAALQICLKWN